MSKIRRTYLFVIGLLLFSITTQVALTFFIHIPRTNIYRIILDLWEIALLGLPILLFFLITKEKPRAVFQFHKISFKNIAYIALLVILFIPITGVIGMVSRLIFPNPVLQNTMMSMASRYPLWLTLIIVALQPALLEELVFRGIVSNGFDGYPLKRQALLVGLCFGLFHLNFNQTFYAVVMGVLMVYIFYYTKSIIAPMVFHFAFNGIDVTISHLLASHANVAITSAAHTVAANPYSAAILIGTFIDMGILLVIFVPLFRAAYRSFVRYNKIRLGMIDPVVPLSVAALDSGAPVVVQNSVPVYAQYAPPAIQASIRVAAPSVPPSPAPSILPAQPAQLAVSEQPNSGAASPESSEPLSTHTASPTKKQRLFTPLLIVMIVMAIGFATFVQIYDTLIR